MNKTKQDLVKATEKDLPSIELLLKSVKLPFEGVKDHIGNFLLLYEESHLESSFKLIGCVGLELYNENALLRSLAVDPQKQKLGIGKELTEAIITYAKEKGIKHLYLRTDTAEKFFLKRNFKIVSLDEIPTSVKESVEFSTSVCPVSAINMFLEL